MKKILEMCKWIVENLGEDVPVHFSRFFPHYKLKNLPPTPFETLRNAWETALNAGLRYAYIGNIRSNAENTYCPNCKRLLIERIGYLVRQNNIVGGKCRYCGTQIAGLWEA
jgi:pyruvate formate lyase activating enzyme